RASARGTAGRTGRPGRPWSRPLGAREIDARADVQRADDRIDVAVEDEAARAGPGPQALLAGGRPHRLGQAAGHAEQQPGEGVGQGTLVIRELDLFARRGRDVEVEEE